MNKELEMLLDFNQCLLADGFMEAIWEKKHQYL